MNLPWAQFALNVRRDAAAWLMGMLALSVYRVVLAWPTFDGLASAGIAQGLWMGLRFDSVVVTLAVLPTLILAAVAATAGQRWDLGAVRWTVLTIAAVTTALVYAANLEFKRVYGVQIDQRALALLNDADGALRETIWQAHRPVTLVLGALLAATGWLALTAHALRRVRPGFPAGVSPGAARLVLMLVLVVLVVGLVRGISWGVSPVRIRTAHVTPSTAFNQLIPSPYAFFLFALEQHHAAVASPRPEQIAEDLRTVGQIGGRTLQWPGMGGGQPVQAVALSAAPRVRHIVLIVLEGQHGFALRPAYRHLNLLPGLATLADEGAWFEQFIPSGRQTDNTLATLVAGILSPEHNVLTDIRAHRELPTSTAPMFRRLGYQTHFFYGGYAGWSRLDEFVRGQGFEHLHTRADIGSRRPGNAWGVWDEHLFDHVLARLDPARPSFSLVLTTNNHSPFDTAPALAESLDGLSPVVQSWDEHTHVVLRHERYLDRQVLRFVRAARQRLPDALFVITGDHTEYTARFKLPGASELDSITVPMIFTGPALPAALRGRQLRPASHLDIVPTLLGLAIGPTEQPAGFGTNLFDAGGPAHALGARAVLVDGRVVPLQEPAEPPDAAPVHQARAHHRAVVRLSAALLAR